MGRELKLERIIQPCYLQGECPDGLIRWQPPGHHPPLSLYHPSLTSSLALLHNQPRYSARGSASTCPARCLA